ncbi:MAG: NfeD family protein [Phycisphaerales bacterium]
MHGVIRSIPVRLFIAALSLICAVVLGSLTAYADIATPGLPTSVSASRQANSVVVITIDDAIDAITARSFRRRLDEAVALKADAVVVELNTPGGELGAVLEISNAIKQSPIRNTIAWIHPMAYSGGAIVALACREIVVSDGSSFGDAKVVHIDQSSFTTQLRGMNETERQKLLPPLLADVVDSARRHNRSAGAYQWDELLVQAIVATDAELWWVQDNKTGVRFAVDRAEFERLFPDKPVLQPVLATASVGSNEVATRGARSAGRKPRPIPADNTPAEPTAEGATAPTGTPAEAAPSEKDAEAVPFTPAAPSLADIKSKTQDALDLAGATPSMRPRSHDNSNGRYTLLAKISNGDGAIVLHEQEMAFFQLASNTRPGPDGVAQLDAVNSDADLTKFLGATNITRLDESWSEALARFMSASWIRGILITIFLICIFIEMFSPGVTLPAAIAVLCLAGLFLPSLIVGMAMWWQLAAIVVGVLLLGAEIFILPGFGVAGVVGLLALFIGMIGVFIPGSSGTSATAAEFRAGLATGVTTMLLAGATAWMALFFIYRNISNIPALRRLVLRNPEFEGDGVMSNSMFAAMSDDEVRVGDTGTATTPLRPAGKVDINGQLRDVVAEFGFVDAGKRVKVVNVTAFRIGVDAIRES